MKRSPHFRAMTFSALGGAVLVTPLLAAPAQAAPPSPKVRAQAIGDAAEKRVTAYWTHERMRSAVPMERLFKARPSSQKAVKRGVKQQFPATKALPLLTPGAAWTQGGKVARTAGRVFFTFQGRNASCSGDAVTSANRSTVITAGHCVKLEGSWHTNWVFVPGYDDGQRPYGTWTARQTLTTPQWDATEDINYDVGAAVVNSLDGRNLVDAVGGQGIAFNQDRGQTMYAFGYPAEAPYDGSALTYCSGPVINDLLGTTAQGMTCTMTGGSSGGPWFLSFDEATGTGVQNSVNSFKYNFLPTHMFGPYFGADAQNLYRRAQSS
ncbi:peptidase [Actinomadura sp. NBRC 104412]|uniref:trypsin-like serine peptidase n=1 Tax=Actinomadura sp. NBRC 104412 TaxID=3032203 RepID=UPI00249FD9DF|nr:peptidase [Actinomadura sp. NBRC 104412]GLZ07088.1 peptidase [Actinomadura sp. NBRC 104412]